MIEFECSGCSKSMRVADEYSGKRVKCPGCGEGIRVPGGQSGSSRAKEGMIKFRCSHCNQKIGLPARYAGKQVKCAKCREAIWVPKGQSRAAPDASSKIKFSCGHCGQKFGVAAKYAGKRVKCTKCGQGVVVPKVGQAPVPAAPEPDGSDFGGMRDQDGWAADLLAMEASAPEAEDVLRVKPVEPDGAGSQGDAFEGVAALNRGFAGGTESQTRRGGGFSDAIGDVPLAIGASFGGAVLGAIIWFVIAKVTGFQIGYVACGVGALAGAGMTAFTDRRSIGLGVLAAFFGICGILMGKMSVAKWVVLPRLQEEMVKFVTTDEIIIEVVNDPNMMLGVACLALAEEGELDEELAMKTFLVRMAADPPPEAVADTESAREMASELLESWSGKERVAAARAQAGRLMAKTMNIAAKTNLGLIVAFVATFSLLDPLWFLLALGSAYKLGSGMGQ